MNKMIPKHIHLKHELKAWIINGGLQKGELLPSFHPPYRKVHKKL